MENIGLIPKNPNQQSAIYPVNVTQLEGKGRNEASRRVYAIGTPVFIEEEGCGEALIIVQVLTQALCYRSLPRSRGSPEPDKTCDAPRKTRDDRLKNANSCLLHALFPRHGTELRGSGIQSPESI